MSRNDWPVTFDRVTGCWLWDDEIDREGYAIIRKGPVILKAYGCVYRQEVGDVPDGKVLDHWCRRRKCVAPAHLEPVTQSVNERRKRWRNRVKLKTCPNGHDMWINGRRTEEGGRVCRVCSGV